MSQLVINHFSGDRLQQLQPDSGSLVKPDNNKIFVLGGSNVNTTASNNTIRANLDDAITIDSAAIGNLNFASNTVSSTNTNGDILLDPTDYIEFCDEASNAALLVNGSSQITSATINSGQLIIGSTGSVPVAAEITAGTGISITNAAGSITISATGQGGGGVGWNDNVFTGAENRNIEMESNQSYVADSTIATRTSGTTNVPYCPRYPIYYTAPSNDDYSTGDCFQLLNRNIGYYAFNVSPNQALGTVAYLNGTFSSANLFSARGYIVTRTDLPFQPGGQPRQQGYPSNAYNDGSFLCNVSMLYIEDVTHAELPEYSPYQPIIREYPNYLVPLTVLGTYQHSDAGNCNR